MALGSTTRVKDSGSNYQGFADKAPEYHPSRSVFDLSYLHTLTANEGELLPVGVWECLPDSDYDFSVQALIRVQPMEVPSMSRLRAFFHLYYIPYSQLWKHWQSFYSKGHSRSYAAQLPCVVPGKFSFTPSGSTGTIRTGLMVSNQDCTTDNLTVSMSSPLENFPQRVGTLLELFGCVVPVYQLFGKRLDGFAYNSRPYWSSVGFNLLFPFAYQHIYRDYYLPQQITLNSKVWWPDDDEDFRLNDVRITGAGSIRYDTAGNAWYLTDSLINSYATTVTQSGFTLSNLLSLRYRCWTDDYFTSATPTPVYGDEPSLTLTASSSIPVRQLEILPSGQTFSNPFHVFLDGGSGIVSTSSIQVGTTGEQVHHVGVPANTVLSSFTVEQLRVLAVNQLAIEKMTRTDGSYREFVRAFFGVTPGTSHDTRAQYIGGAYQPIAVSEVLQTSESSSSSPLGESAGHGISASGQSLGHLHTTEYGVAMLIMSIMPDTIYSQGRERWLSSDLTQEDYYLPERSQLGPQFITNVELFNDLVGKSSNDVPSVPDATGIFGYQGRFDHLRYRQNRISGWISNPYYLNYFSYTQSRLFTNQPTLNWLFLACIPPNVRSQMYTSPNEPHFIVQVANICRAVQPLPYVAIPSNVLN